MIPAPTFSLLPLGVGAPEVSPWLIALNGSALLLTVVVHPSRLSALSLIGSLLGLMLSLVPVSQLPKTNEQFAAEMTTGLGKDYRLLSFVR